MPAKTNTDLLRELMVNKKALEARSDERDRRNDKQDEMISKLVEALNALDRRLSVLEVQFADQKKTQEERQKLRLQFWLTVLTAVVALSVGVGNILVALLRK